LNCAKIASGRPRPRNFPLPSSPLAVFLSAMTRYEAFLDKDWRDLGIANIIVIRVRGDGSADFSAFLVDLLCLGVKDAFSDFDIMEAELRDHLDLRLPPEGREFIHPACAKKLIEGAIAYAQDLGFAPHRDYRKARKVLSSLDTA